LAAAVDRESIQMMLGDLAMQIEIGRLLVMKAAWELDRGGYARKEVSMAKVHVANLLHKAADVAIQINGARGYSLRYGAGMDLPLCPAGAAGGWRR
jgi:acyl-CoA dehydrogenase